MRELDRSTFFKLLLLVNLTARPFARQYERRYQISLPEWRVMFALAARPGVSAARIGEQLGLDKMAVSRAVRALERRGRLQRRPDATDQRRAELRLSDEGLALFNHMAPAGEAREDALLEALSQQERATLGQLLDKLIARARLLQEDVEDDEAANDRQADRG